MVLRALWLFLIAVALNTLKASAQSASQDVKIITLDEMAKLFGFEGTGVEDCKDCNPQNNSKDPSNAKYQDLLFTDSENNHIQVTTVKLQKIFDEFVVKLEETFYEPKQYLDSQKQNKDKVNDIRRTIDDIVVRSKLVIQTIIDFYYVTSNNYVKTLKSLRNKMNKTITTFKNDILQLRCALVKNSEDAYRRCLEDVYENFTNIVAEVRNEIEPVLYTLEAISGDVVIYVEQKTGSVLKDAEEKVLDILIEIYELRKYEQEKDDKQFLENKSNYTLKQLDNIVDNLNSAIAGLKNPIETAVDSVLTKLDLTYAIPLEKAVDKYAEALGCAKPPLDATTIQDKIRTYLEGKTKIIFEYLVAQNLSEASVVEWDKTELENKTKALLTEYSAEIVTKKCKKENPFQFIICVNATYDELQEKINALEIKAKVLYKSTGKLLQDFLQAFLKIENDVLKEAADDAKKEIKSIEDLAAVPLRNHAYANVTIKNYQDLIYPQVDALFNSNISSAVKSLSTVLDKMSSNFIEKLTSLVSASSKETLSENNRKFIQDYGNIIAGKIGQYNKQASDYKDYAQMYIKVFYGYLNIDVKSSLLIKCEQYVCDTNAFADCARDIFNTFNVVLNQFLYDLNAQLKKIEDVQVDAEFTLGNEIKRLLQTAGDAYTSTDPDENIPNTVILSKCLEAVNKNINESFSKFVSSAIFLRDRFRLTVTKETLQGINKLNDIRNPVLEALLITIYSSVNGIEQYIRQKEELLAYNEETSAEIYNFADQVVASFIEQTRKVLAAKEEISSRQAAFAENLNSSCETVGTSEKQYAQCIEEQCSNFNKYLDNSVSLLNTLFSDTNITYFSILNEFRTNMESRIKAAEEKSRSELKNLPDYAVTDSEQTNLTLSNAIVSKCQNALNKRLDSLHQIGAVILSIQEDLKITIDREIQAAKTGIKLALFYIKEALDFIIKQVKPTEAEKYYEQKFSVEAYEENALIRLYDSVNQNSDVFYKAIYKLADINQVLSQYRDNVNDLSNICQVAKSSIKLVAACVNSQCSSWRASLDETENDLNAILKVTSESFPDITSKLRNNAELEQRRAEEKALNERTAILAENNLSQESVLNAALTGVEINTASLKEKLSQINKAAENLRAVENRFGSRGNQFNDLPLLLSKHEKNMLKICPYALFNNELNKTRALVVTARNDVLKAFPDQSDYINKQINLSQLYEATLEDQLRLIQPDDIKASCADVLLDFVNLYKCAQGIVKRFNDASATFNTEWSEVAEKAEKQLVERSNSLEKWANEYVIAQYNNTLLQVKQGIENIYKGVCNVGKTNLNKYAKNELSERYATLWPSLQRLYRNISATQLLITSRNYDDIVDINQELSIAVDSFRVAVAAAQKKNTSYINTKLQEEVDQYLSNATKEFIKFLANIKSNAVTLKEQSLLTLQKAANIVASLDDERIDKCFSNDTSPTKRTQEIDCLNNQIDYFEQQIIEACLRVMEGFSKDLQIYTNRRGVVLDYVNKLQTGLRAYSAHLAVKVYKENLIDVPEYLKSYA